jgi:hypothetical protein
MPSSMGMPDPDRLEISRTARLAANPSSQTTATGSSGRRRSVR